MKKLLSAAALIAAMTTGSVVQAADYVIDTKGAHASIEFKIKHLGYSWLTGRFNTFEGNFSYDEKQPNSSSIEVTIDTTSLDSNHSDRDKHLKGKDFLNVSKFSQANFSSSSITFSDADNAKVSGNFTLHGVTKAITFDITKIGAGNDPWGGYRAGFSGTVSLKLADYGIDYNLGPASTHVDITLHVEGVRQK